MLYELEVTEEQKISQVRMYCELKNEILLDRLRNKMVKERQSESNASSPATFFFLHHPYA